MVYEISVLSPAYNRSIYSQLINQRNMFQHRKSIKSNLHCDETKIRAQTQSGSQSTNTSKPTSNSTTEEYRIDPYLP